MALNLSRNSKLFVTSNVDPVTGVLATSGFLATNTFEIQVLDGFTFSQNTNTETVTLNEAGTAPVRGQRSFNTSLAPVDFSFSTYIRPEKDTNIVAEESPLWGLLTYNLVGTNRGFTTSSTTAATLTLAGSNVNQLQKAALIMIIDNVTYAIDNIALNQATIDFGIDQIATIQWTGFGSAIRQLATNVVATAGTFSGGIASGNYFVKDSNADFITNKLSTATLVGTTPAVATRTIAITGGNLTYNNNITFLTPNNIAVVNQPITYFTGTRSITGSLTAYLKTGGTDVGELLSTMLSNTNNTETRFSVVVDIGGTVSTNPRVKLNMPTCTLQIPTVDVQQVVSTMINFTAQGFTAGAYDVATPNELDITYATS